MDDYIGYMSVECQTMSETTDKPILATQEVVKNGFESVVKALKSRGDNTSVREVIDG